MVRPRALVIERTLLITQNLCTSQTRRRHFQNDGQHVRSCLSGYLTSGLYWVRGVLASLTRLSAAFRSSFKNAANAAGLVGAGTTNCCSKNSWNFESVKVFTNSVLIRSM